MYALSKAMVGIWVTAGHLADDDPAQRVGQRGVEAVDLDLEVVVVDAADLVAQFALELLGVEAVVDGDGREAACILDVVRLGQWRLRC